MGRNGNLGWPPKNVCLLMMNVKVLLGLKKNDNYQDNVQIFEEYDLSGCIL